MTTHYLKLPNPKIIVLIGLFILSLLIVDKCNGQSYLTLQFDPSIMTGGPRVDLITKNICINTSYSIGKAPYYDPITLEYSKVVFNQYQIGLGYNFKRLFNDEETTMIVSIFGSYNKINHKYWRKSWGISIFIPISNGMSAVLDTDLVIWSTKIGLGIKLYNH